MVDLRHQFRASYRDALIALRCIPNYEWAPQKWPQNVWQQQQQQHIDASGRGMPLNIFFFYLNSDLSFPQMLLRNWRMSLRAFSTGSIIVIHWRDGIKEVW